MGKAGGSCKHYSGVGGSGTYGMRVSKNSGDPLLRLQPEPLSVLRSKPQNSQNVVSFEVPLELAKMKSDLERFKKKTFLLPFIVLKK